MCKKLCKTSIKASLSLLVVLLLLLPCIVFSASAEVTVKSLSVEPMEVIENYDGFVTTDIDFDTYEETDEYFYYNDFERMVCTVILSDGTVVANDGYYIDYGDDYLEIEVETDQSYENQWTVGNTYTVVVSVLGVETEVPVTVVPSPVKSVDLDSVAIYEGTSGIYNADYDWDTYEETPEYFYYVVYVESGTVTFKDGTTGKIEDEHINYKGQYYDFWVDIEQSYYNQMKAGKTYTGEVSVLGYDTSVDVTVMPSPISKIEMYTLELVDGVDGFYDFDIDWETGTESPEYFRYVIYGESGTVTFKDGTTSKIEYGIFEYEGKEYYLDAKYDQSYDSQWTIGNTYTVEVSAMNVTAPMNVTIISASGSLLMLGDVNQDGEVSIKDATLVQKSAANMVTFTASEQLSADVDNSGDVTVKDATAIQKYTANMEVDYPIGDYVS